jgi:putative restriction endonuclease
MHDSFRSTRTAQNRAVDVPDRGNRGAAGRPADLAGSLLDRIARIRRYQRNGYVAPNKPITLLWALARLEEGEQRLVDYATAVQELQPLLDAYAQGRTSPVHAFWALQNDGFWEVTGKDKLVLRAGSRAPTDSSLLEHASGGFQEEAHELFAADQELRRAATWLLREMLREGVPATIYVPPASGARETTSRLRRHAAFRVGVMTEFGARCAVCGWSVKKSGRPVALTAAHVHSLEEKGPDEPGNGMVLCWFHHALFDAGLFSYDEQRRLVVSGSWREEGRGSMPSLLDYIGMAMPEPMDSRWRVRDLHLEWHRRNVFAG